MLEVTRGFPSQTWGQFHVSKVQSKIPPGGIPLNSNGLFSTYFWLNICLLSNFEETITLC